MDKNNYDHRIQLATQHEELASKQKAHTKKQYKRARTLHESDAEVASRLKDKINFEMEKRRILGEKVKKANQENLRFPGAQDSSCGW